MRPARPHHELQVHLGRRIRSDSDVGVLNGTETRGASFDAIDIRNQMLGLVFARGVASWTSTEVPLLTSVMVIFALGMAAPVGSVTWP